MCAGSYVPVSGAKIVERVLAPLDPQHALLIGRIRSPDQQTLRLVLRRVSGLPNPLYFPGHSSHGFDRFVDLFCQLRDAGHLDVAASKDGSFALLIHDYEEEDRDHVTELLSIVGVSARPADRRSLTIPLHFTVGSPRTEGIDFETASALEIMQAAAAGVEMPHQPNALPSAADAPAPAALPTRSFLTIRRSTSRPQGATVAVPHGGAWYYIDAADVRSKRGFVFLRTIINIRIDDSAGGAGVPTLTVPVSR